MMGDAGKPAARVRAISPSRKGFLRRPAALSLAVVVAGLTMSAIASGTVTPGSIDATFNVPKGGASNVVTKVVALDDGSFLIAGAFTRYNNKLSPRFAKLNSDGTLNEGFAADLGVESGADSKLARGFNASVSDFAVQPDGKIVVVGTFTTVGVTRACGVARLNSDGTLDAEFNSAALPAGTSPGATKTDGKTCSWVSAVAMQGDKAIIGGIFASYDGNPRSRIARLNTDGTLDTNFAKGVSTGALKLTTTAGSTVATLSATTGLQPGSTYKISSTTLPAAPKVVFTTGKPISTRVTLSAPAVKSGSSVNAVVSTTGPDGAVSALAVNGDSGEVYVGGSFSIFDASTRNRLARLTPDGTVDVSWSPGVGPDAQVSAIALAKDEENAGKVYIGGTFTKFGTATRNRIARVDSHGVNDTSFDPKVGLPAGSTTAPGFNGFVSSLAPQADGSIYVGGSFTKFNGEDSLYLAKLNPTGETNPDFVITPVRAVGNTVQSVTTDSSGMVIVGGWFTKGVARLDGTGLFDYDAANGTGFNLDTATSANSTVSAIDASSDDGTILIGGNFTKYNGEAHSKVARVNSDGTPDSGFDAGTLNGPVSVVKRLASGKVLIGGSFTTITRPDENGDPVAQSVVGIALLNDDGTLDTSFSAGAGPSKDGDAAATVTAIAVQNDDKILVGGDFTSFDGETWNRLVRLRPNGTVDDSFDPGTGADATVQAVALQPDGKIVVVGDFVTFNDVTVRRLLRLDPTGARDSSFVTGTGADGPIKALAIQKDQKIVLGGYFSQFNGQPSNRIARLTTNGTLDGDFDTGVTLADFTIQTTKGSATAVLSDTSGLQPSTNYGIYTTGKSRAISKAARVTFTTSSDVDPDSGNVSPNITLSTPAAATAVDVPVNVVLRGAAGGGAGGGVRAIALRPGTTQKIVAVGSFKTFDGRPRNQIVRLESTGALDKGYLPYEIPAFTGGTGPDGYRLDAVALQADKNILVGGSFSAFRGTARNNLARLYG